MSIYRSKGPEEPTAPKVTYRLEKLQGLSKLSHIQLHLLPIVSGSGAEFSKMFSLTIFGMEFPKQTVFDNEMLCLRVLTKYRLIWSLKLAMDAGQITFNRPMELKPGEVLHLDVHDGVPEPGQLGPGFEVDRNPVLKAFLRCNWDQMHRF